MQAKVIYIHTENILVTKHLPKRFYSRNNATSLQVPQTKKQMYSTKIKYKFTNKDDMMFFKNIKEHTHCAFVVLCAVL